MLWNYINCLTIYPERADYSHSLYNFMKTNIMFGITMLIKLTELRLINISYTKL